MDNSLSLIVVDALNYSELDGNISKESKSDDVIAKIQTCHQKNNYENLFTICWTITVPSFIVPELANQKFEGVCVLFYDHKKWYLKNGRSTHFLVSTGVAFFCAKFQYWSCLASCLIF